MGEVTIVVGTTGGRVKASSPLWPADRQHDRQYVFYDQCFGVMCLDATDYIILVWSRCGGGRLHTSATCKGAHSSLALTLERLACLPSHLADCCANRAGSMYVGSCSSLTCSGEIARTATARRAAAKRQRDERQSDATPLALTLPHPSRPCPPLSRARCRPPLLCILKHPSTPKK